MANIAIFRINYKSDFILTLNSDAGWMTPFCIKFWTGAPSQAYFVGYDGTTYTRCAPVDGDPTKLLVQFDDHHLPIGDLKFQIGYHFTVADFPTSVEDEVINQASVIIEQDGEPAQVMLDFNGETAPEIEFSLPAYANEAQRIANEQERIAAEQQRIANEDARIAAEETRQYNEQQRIQHEEYRVSEFATLKSQSQAATSAANAAATLANEKAQLAADKAALAQAAATLANEKAQLAADKAALAAAAATLANDKATLAQQKAAYAQAQGDYAKAQGDYAKAQGDTAQADHERAEADHTTAATDHQTAAADHTTAASDHSRAEADHTTASSDHTRAESDHTTASSDHTRAESDHTTAASDHTCAESDHTTAAADHTTAQADHTRAESDHTAVEMYVDSLGVFDLSKHNAVGGVLATYADLDAALNALNALDSKYKYGGMSFKFVQSSDNKYVRFNYLLSDVTTADTFTNVNNWQGVDDALDKISEINKEYISNEDEEFRFESNNGDLIGKVTPQGADFVEIKKNGKTVATEDELPIKDTSIGETPSNSNVPTTKAVKDYVDENCTGSFPMSKETIQSEDEEFILSDNAGNENYVKMGSYGIKALAYLDINGNPIAENNEKAVTKGLFYDEGDKFLVTGASFVTASGSDSGWTPEINGYNRWFEDACNKLQVTPINHAIGGQSILNTASMMRDADSTKPHGSLFMDGGVDVFDDVSVFVIMHVHNQNVFYTGAKSLADYISDGVSGYAEAYDYVIKQYEQWCIDAGKYCQILLCTHWHDARVTYNQSIRKVGIKWGLPVCQFDAEIGFSKNTPLDNGKQISVYNSWDSSGQIAGSVETIDGVEYGWHMKKPTYTTVDNYQLSDIQKRMSKIFQKCFI